MTRVYGSGPYGSGPYGGGTGTAPARVTVLPYSGIPFTGDLDSIELSVRISRSDGAWIELNDHSLFTVAEGSFAEEAVTLRRQEDTNSFLEGSWTVNALRQNVTRPLNIYVSGATHYDNQMALDTLKALVAQPYFSVVRTVENSATLWECFPSDYAVTTDRPLLHARKSLFKCSLMTLPYETTYEEI